MKTHGFTLIELMVVVVILGVLASTAVPLYHAYVNNAAHSEAKVNLVDIATKEEAYYAVNRDYVYTTISTADIPKPYTRKAQAGSNQWAQLGYSNNTAENGGVFGGPLYYYYSISKTIPASTYEIKAQRQTDDGQVETMSLNHNSPNSIITNVSSL